MVKVKYDALYRKRGQMLNYARDLARSGEHVDHQTIILHLAAMEGHRQLGAGLGGEGWDGWGAGMTSATKSPYAGFRFPGEVISHAVWLWFRFPLSLRMVEEMLAARGIE